MDTPTNNILDTLIKYLVVALAVFAGVALFFVNASASVLSFIVHCLIIAVPIFFSWKNKLAFWIFIHSIFFILITGPCQGSLTAFFGICEYLGWVSMLMSFVYLGPAAVLIVIVFAVINLFSQSSKPTLESRAINGNNPDKQVDVEGVTLVGNKKKDMFIVGGYFLIVVLFIFWFLGGFE